MSEPAEPDAPWHRRCLQVFNGGHLVIVIISALGIAGSAVGVYTSLRSDITELQRSLVDITKDMDRFQTLVAEREAEQKRYDAEVRGRVLDADQEIRASLRLLADKLIDLAKERR